MDSLNFEEQLDEKTKIISDMENEIQSRDKEIESKDQEIECKDQEIRELKINLNI